LFDDVGLNSVVCLGLGVAGMRRSSGTVTRHHLCLTTDDSQNTPVADDEDYENSKVEIHEVADPVDYFDDSVLPDDVAMAHAVDNGARLESDGHVEKNGAKPRECRHTARRPLAQMLPAPDWVDDLQIAVNGDDMESRRRRTHNLYLLAVDR